MVRGALTLHGLSNGSWALDLSEGRLAVGASLWLQQQPLVWLIEEAIDQEKDRKREVERERKTARLVDGDGKLG